VAVARLVMPGLRPVHEAERILTSAELTQHPPARSGLFISRDLYFSSAEGPFVPEISS
jgi:hypothetical protein